MKNRIINVKGVDITIAISWIKQFGGPNAGKERLE